MKIVISLLCSFLFLPHARAGSETTAFIGVNVVPMTSSVVMKNQTVLVQGDRIVAIGDQKRIRVAAGASRIDGRGKFLMPGLAEMHGHIPPPTASRATTENVLFLYLANGITTVRGMLGHPGQLALRAEAVSGTVASPTLYLAGPSFNDQSIGTPEEAIARVRQQKAEGWDLLKVHPGLTREEYDAMSRTAREVGIPFGGHVPAAVGIEHAIAAGQQTFDHLDGYLEFSGGFEGSVDEAKLALILAKTRQAGAWVVPTMALWEVLINALPLEELKKYPELRYTTPREIEQWSTAYERRKLTPFYKQGDPKQIAANRIALLRAMSRAGVRILMGTDAPQQFSVPGFSLHRELHWMSKAGMSPYEILVSGTRSVGEYFKSSDTFGTIAKGSRADLVLLDSNPLNDVAALSRISGVMARGRWYSRATIDRRLGLIAAATR